MVSKNSKENVSSFSNLDAPLKKNKADLDVELKAEIEAHVQSLEQEFKVFSTFKIFSTFG